MSITLYFTIGIIIAIIILSDRAEKLSELMTYPFLHFIIKALILLTVTMLIVLLWPLFTLIIFAKLFK